MALIACPANADDNNGNWRTAERWARLMRPHWASQVLSIHECLAEPEIMARADVLIALHAKRSAAVIEAWRAAGERALVVVMTGTDLYQDILTDRQAQHSLAVATRLVVLQPLGLTQLPERWRDKACTIIQSTSTRRPRRRALRYLRVLMVGHLRQEKSPETWFDAVQMLSEDPRFRFDHIGAALDPDLGARAQALQESVPHFRYLGPRRHPEVRRRMQSADLLVHCSRLEGGAHVVMEAVCSGSAVLASRIDGNVGLLGTDYAGYFRWGDAAGLAALLHQCAMDRDGLLRVLNAQCANRATLFDPENERRALLDMLDELVPF